MRNAHRFVASVFVPLLVLALASCGSTPVATTLDAEGSDSPSSGDSSAKYVINCEEGLCHVPAGPFWMGCNEALDDQCNYDETPYRLVTLEDFYIQRSEVTQSSYNECMLASVCDKPSCEFTPDENPDHPVVCVTQQDAVRYCDWLGMRLPTEAEWEKAARGVDGQLYPWGNEAASCLLAAIEGEDGKCGLDSSVPVCSRSPSGDSPYGLCDMAGNVWEWVSDCYEDDYYGVAPDTAPSGPKCEGLGSADDLSSLVVQRGGSFADESFNVRASNRASAKNDSAEGHRGFRCATRTQEHLGYTIH